MRTSLKVLLVGLGVFLVLGAVVVGTAAAQTPTPVGTGGFHTAVWAKAAAILGVPEATLADAFAQAHAQALDDAVKAGYLTQAQADWMKQHQQWMLRNGMPGPGMMGGYGRGVMGGGYGPGMGRFGGGYGPPWSATPTR